MLLIDDLATAKCLRHCLAIAKCHSLKPFGKVSLPAASFVKVELLT